MESGSRLRQAVAVTPTTGLGIAGVCKPADSGDGRRTLPVFLAFPEESERSLDLEDLFLMAVDLELSVIFDLSGCPLVLVDDSFDARFSRLDPRSELLERRGLRLSNHFFLGGGAEPSTVERAGGLEQG